MSRPQSLAFEATVLSKCYVYNGNFSSFFIGLIFEEVACIYCNFYFHLSQDTCLRKVHIIIAFLCFVGNWVPDARVYSPLNGSWCSTAEKNNGSSSLKSDRASWANTTRREWEGCPNQQLPSCLLNRRAKNAAINPCPRNCTKWTYGRAKFLSKSIFSTKTTQFPRCPVFLSIRKSGPEYVLLELWIRQPCEMSLLTCHCWRVERLRKKHTGVLCIYFPTSLSECVS